MGRLNRKEGLCAIAAGVLVALAMPGLGLSGLIFVGLIPWFYALDRGGGLRGGILFGLAFFALDLRWILTLVRFNPLVVPGFMLLIVYLSIPFLLFGVLLKGRRTGRAEPMWILLAPALFVVAESVRSWGPLGTGFSMLYQALYRVPWLIQPAAVLGSWAITAFVVAINVSLYFALREKKLRFFGLAVGLFALQSAFSLVPTAREVDAHPLEVAVVSSNVRQEVKLDARNLAALTERYFGLGEEAIAREPDMVVFPESFLPAYILRRDEVLSRLADLARTGNARLLFGTGDLRNGAIYNSTVLVDATGEVAGVYDMVRPVPFGEYIPGRSILESIGLGSWAHSLLPLDLSRGKVYTPLDRFGTPICFESTFSTPSRRFAADGASLLVIVTNDAWFAGSSELRAHFAAAVFRAVETRRWVVQAANGGISGFVSPRGKIHSETLEEGVSTAHVFLADEPSTYTRWGDGPLIGGLGAAAGILLIRRRSRKEQQNGE